jgi:hypothetical protein
MASASINHPVGEQVFVLGHQKAGTSALASLLGAISGIEPVLDPFYTMERGRARELQKLFKHEKSIAEFTVEFPQYFAARLIKDPDLTFFYSELREANPSLQAVFVVRDPRDNIRSILNRLTLPGNLAELDERCQRILTGEKSTRAWRLMLDGKMPETPPGNYIERLAWRWQLAADTYLQHMSAMTLVRYEDFLINKVAVVADVARRAGLPPVHNIADRVDVQYQPRGDNSASWQEFFGARNLALIETVCGDVMRKFSYSPTVNSVKAAG